MAQIKMDVSEYEEMKKRAALLESALADKTRMQNKIDKLQKEKVKALEDAKMSVVYTTKSTKEEIVYDLRKDDDVWRRMISYMNLPQTFKFAKHHTMMSEHASMDTLEQYEHVLRIVEKPPGFEGARLAEMLFTKSNTISEGEPETVIRGLDEVKAEMHKKAVDNIDAKAKSAIEEIPLLLTKNTALHKDLKKSIKVAGDLEKELTRVMNERDDAHEILEQANEQDTRNQRDAEKYHKIASEMVHKYPSWFGKATLLDSIHKIIQGIE